MSPSCFLSRLLLLLAIAANFLPNPAAAADPTPNPPAAVAPATPPISAPQTPPVVTPQTPVDPARQAAALELLTAMHSDRPIGRAVDQMSLMADRMAPLGRTSATPQEEATFRASLHQQAKDVLQEQLSWQKLEPEIAKLYADAFTEAELKQLTEFYKSPVGEKLLEKQPELSSKFTLISRQKMSAAAASMTQKLKANVQKFREDHPAPTPAATPVPGSVAPGVVPAPTTAPGAPVTAVSPPLTVPRPSPATVTPPAATPTPTPAQTPK